MTAIVKEFYDKDTATFSYVISDNATKMCAIIDSVLNYDLSSAKTATYGADEIIDYVKSNNLKLQWIIETHIHADHLTASHYIKEKLGGKTVTSEKICEVLKFWVPFFNLTDEVALDGSQFDVLIKDKEKFKIGQLECQAFSAPGHTPSCMFFKIEDMLFVGDIIFMPDVGTARTDFPGGSAQQSYESLQKILAFSDKTKIYTGHDYPPQNRPLACVSTVGEQKEGNILISVHNSKEEFIKIRSERDKDKPVPKLLLPAIQVNIRAGALPKAEDNGVIYLKFPVGKL